MSRKRPQPDREEAEKTLLEHLRRPEYEPIALREILAQLEVPREQRPVFRRVVRSLLREGDLVSVGGHRLAAASRATVRGRLHLHPRGFGFVVPEEPGKDVFIPPRKLGGAFHGDAVEVRVTGADSEGRSEGEIVQVVERGRRRVQGLFLSRDRGGVVQPFDAAQGSAIVIPASFRMGAEDRDAVEVLVLRPPRRGDPAEGKIVEVFGPLEAPGVDSIVVARKHELAMEFSEEAIAAAGALPIAVPRAEALARERFDDPPPVTIDGETARDFDDAIAVAPLAGGGFRLFVHIADVAYFVPLDGPLDREARARGTSVYFPDRVLPMFPERLSNDLCSLRPGEDRLVQSVILDLDARGDATTVRFADGVIRSAARLTYTQVAAALETERGAHRIRRGLLPTLHAADALREILETKRRARGSVDFDLPEPRILLDVEGVMTGIAVEPRNRAHRLIEEFMIAANEAVASHLEAHGVPCLYRVHEKPDPIKVEALAEFARGLGLLFHGDPERTTPRDIQTLLDAAEGRPEYPLISQVALRSMKQARYSPENTGHFGLAAPIYAHFTSPIRRYPDLVVHRLLRAHRTGRRGEIRRIQEDLEPLSLSCSRLEREAEAAERELLEWKKIAFMKGKEGQAHGGIVSGVARFGLFVELRESLIEGLVRVERLGDDRFEFDERKMELRGSRTGRVFRLGDLLDVVVERVDPVLRRVDLGLVGGPAAARSRGPSRRVASRGHAPRRRSGDRAGRRGRRRRSRA